MTPTPFSDVQLIGTAAFLTTSKTLVLADLHLGAEAAMVKSGILLPRTQRDETFSRIKELLERTHPAHVVLDGDLKHEFGGIHDEEWRDVLALVDLITAYAPLTVVQGNHDVLLDPILRKRAVPFTKTIVVDGWLIVHGDAKPDQTQLAACKGLIIGHEHPSLLLDDGVRQEKYKCFLSGDYHGKRLLVLPSTYPLVEGSDVLKEAALGPVLREGKKIAAYVVEGMDVLPFGPLADLDQKI
jgi:putative SbcD/Mre11-related phosphoesterase